MKAPLEEVLRQHPVWRGGALTSAAPALPTGFPALDAELAGGGWPTGALTEILCNHQGIGELGLLLPALAALTRAGKRVVWLSPPHLPYAPALAAAGIDLTQLAVIRAPGRRDALWAAEQVLRAASSHARGREMVATCIDMERSACSACVIALPVLFLCLAILPQRA